MKFLIFSLLFLCQTKIYASNDSNEFNADIDPLKTIIWGPGLYPEQITMRARYFFLQLCNTSGKNISKSPGESIIFTQIQGENSHGKLCHIWKQTLDRKDGSFIVRYKLYHTCFNLRITVKIKGKDIPTTPIILKGPVYEEECYCPNPSIINWLENYKCLRNYSQIFEDLKLFQNVDFDIIRQDIIKKYHKPSSVSICHYVIQANRIHRQCYGQHIGFKIFMDAILLSLARKVVLPDIELFVNLGDWPLVMKIDTIYPIFSWCGSKDTLDIVMPTYDITESSLESMGKVMLDMLSIQGNINMPWEKKIEKVFWRGRDSRRERLNVIDLAREHSELFNASITNFFFFKNEMEKYGPRQDHVSFFNFFEYKYQLNIDGTVAAYRFPYLLAGDSLVLKQDSKYYEFFYNQLIPDRHYVSIKNDLSNLVEKVIWAKEHDENAYNISREGQLFARENLLPQDIICYHAVLFQEWSQRLKNKVKVFADMEEVPQPDSMCKCHIVKSHHILKSKDEF